jgi:hypothetical protein
MRGVMRLLTLLLLIVPVAAHAGAVDQTITVEPRTVSVRADGGHVIAVHPDKVTVVELPERVRGALRSDDQVWLQIQGNQILVRPLHDARPESTVIVSLDGFKLGLIVRQTTSARLADSYVRIERVERSLFSVDVQGLLGVARAGDTRAMGQGSVMEQSDTSFLAGLSARLAVRGSALHAYEGTLTLAQTGTMYFDHVEYDRHEGTMLRNTLLARLLIGARVHVGERVRPFVRLGVGLQGRALVASQLRLENGARMEGPANAYLVDAAASVGVGVDIHVSRKWTAGGCVSATRAITLGSVPMFESLEGAIHVRF